MRRKGESFEKSSHLTVEEITIGWKHFQPILLDTSFKGQKKM
jgi:hypothetical protein